MVPRFLESHYRTVSQTSPLTQQGAENIIVWVSGHPLPSLFHQHCSVEHVLLSPRRYKVGTTQARRSFCLEKMYHLIEN